MLHEMSSIAGVRIPEICDSNEFYRFVDSIKAKINKENLDMLFDCLSSVLINSNCSDKDMNKFLSKHNIMVQCSYEIIGGVYWYTEEKGLDYDKVDELQRVVLPYSKQAYEELEQLKSTLNNAENNRSLKDGLDNAISSLEALLKNITKEKDYETCIKKLIKEHQDQQPILHRGFKLWKLVNMDYKDVRHGTEDKDRFELLKISALYWIDEIINYTNFVVKLTDN